ncbi:MAG TPA: cytochrome c oxidase subunit II [Thermoanaerobaculia bacterium]|nr:cytochrome c oxidase subunit II [Thermoanaerobaculia bacterium]
MPRRRLRDVAPRPASRVLWAAALLGAAALAGCGGIQSALDPAGPDAQRIAELTAWMSGGAAVVWLLVVGLAVYVLRVAPGEHPRRTALLIIGGGAVFPTVVLAGLLAYGLAMIPPLLAPAPPGGPTITVSGEQWWWRVHYQPAGGGAPVELANELRLPVGRRVDVFLESPDVIHAFWVPSITGKIDMVPGRRNRIALEPSRTGLFRGACAEYCGASHALMNFYVVVEEEEDFERWLAHQARPAAPPQGALAARGARLFLAHGCGACHTVRGTPADGGVGPDLTHVGSRVSLAAGVLPNERADLLRWIERTGDIKPEVHMPTFSMLPRQDLQALAAYLEGLR